MTLGRQPRIRGFRDFGMAGAEARISWAFPESEIGDLADGVYWSVIVRPVSNLEFSISGIGMSLGEPVCVRGRPVLTLARLRG
jgi:hypothetical protein